MEAEQLIGFGNLTTRNHLTTSIYDPSFSRASQGLLMPELRKDYITDTWVVISPSRSQRPEDLREVSNLSPAEKCPFCVGHEHWTPPETLAYRGDGPPNSSGWSIRCVPNKYPALEIDGEVQRSDDQLFHRVNGIGAHEVIIETPDHDVPLSALSDFQVREVVAAYRQRYVDLKRDKRLKYILIFKNHGERAGATQSHSHSQLIATPIVPRRIMEEANAAKSHYEATGGSCIWCDVVATELREEVRVVSENEKFVSISPFAARFAFEVWILPKAHEVAFEDIADEDRTPLARMLKDVLGRLHFVLENPPFNYYIHTAPSDGEEKHYHWHLEITPRLTETAGFERGTGFYINPVVPEDAALILRGDVPPAAKAPRGVTTRGGSPGSLHPA